MESVISRHRNLANIVVLVAVLFIQVLALAVQVKLPSDAGSTRLIRVWTVSGLTPFMKAVVHAEEGFANTWHGYFDLRQVRSENQQLKDELARIRVEQVRLIEDANQARRLQLLLGFKEKYISETLPAQIISTTGSEFSRGVYIDKGSHDGIRADMPVISPEGIIGKVLRVFPSTALVLLINDPSSGIGVILEKSRLQGILKGDPRGTGGIEVSYIMSDEKISVGERVLTSGGDRVFPKGLPVGTVAGVSPSADHTFLNIQVKPVADLSRSEEILIITKVDDRSPEIQSAATTTPIRAIDILADRLPTVPPPPPPAPGSPEAKAAAAKAAAAGIQPATPLNGTAGLQLPTNAGTKASSTPTGNSINQATAPKTATAPESKPKAPATESAGSPKKSPGAASAAPLSAPNNSPKPASRAVTNQVDTGTQDAAR